MTRTVLSRIGALLVVAGLPTAGYCDLVNVGAGSFTAAASVITFSEAGYPTGTVNPVYTFTGLPDLGTVTVSFGGTFAGQTATGAAVVTLANNVPTGPLALNSGAPTTFITGDGAMPTSPVLSGTPTFNGPISILFSIPVAGVGLTGGYFDAIGGTSIEAYDSTGKVLGRVTNTQIGNQFFGLADSSGNSVIKGVSFFITGNEPAGFDIDNVTFGARAALVTPNAIPEPSSWFLLASGLVLGFAVHLRRTRAAS